MTDDEDTRQILAEIRDAILRTEAREAAWIEEMRASYARANQLGEKRWNFTYVSTYVFCGLLMLLIAWILFTYYSQ